MPWDLGDTVPLTTEVTDAAGALVPATGVLCTIGLPDGTTVQPSVSNPSTGRYTVDYVPTIPGRHTERWTSTSPATARSDTFDVRAATPAYILSIADAKTHLNIPAASTVHDEELRAFVEALTTVIEGPDGLGRTVVRRAVVESRKVGWATTYLALHHVPVISLTSITDLDGATVWNIADFNLDPDTGVVTVLTGRTPLSGLVQLTYLAGYQVIPGNVTLAAKMCLQEWWRTQRADRGGPRFAGGPNQDDATLRAGWGMSLLIPEARQLLGPPLQGIA